MARRREMKGASETLRSNSTEDRRGTVAARFVPHNRLLGAHEHPATSTREPRFNPLLLIA